MAKPISVSFTSAAGHPGEGALRVAWQGLDERRDLALLIFTETPGLAISGGQLTAGGGASPVLPLSGATGAIELRVTMAAGSTPDACDLTYVLCDEAMPIDRVDANLGDDLPAELDAPSSQRTSRVDGVLLVRRDPNASSPRFRLLLATSGKLIGKRFADLGLLCFRTSVDDAGNGKPLGEFMAEYGERDSSRLPESEYERRGRELWAILPPEFHARYWADDSDLFRLFALGEHGEASTLLIASDDWYFPWEAVAPAPEDEPATPESLSLFGKRAAMSRWQLRDEPPALIEINSAFGWYSGTQGITAGQSTQECSHASAFAETVKPGLSFTPDMGNAPDGFVVSRMREHANGMGHLRAHGAPDRIFTSDFGGVTPAEFRLIVEGQRPRPVFPKFLFVNACSLANDERRDQAQPAGERIYDPKGGFVAALVAGGTQALVTTYWGINLTQGVHVVERYYKGLEEQAGLAESMRRIRFGSLTNGDISRSSTPLAYMVVGHPLARIVSAA
jgi:hypothetical protein